MNCANVAIAAILLLGSITSPEAAATKRRIPGCEKEFCDLAGVIMTRTLNTPRTPYEKVGGLYYLGRCIDKIRLKQAGLLRPDFFELMGKGFDARIMGYLELDYGQFTEFVLIGATDEQCWDYCAQHGRKLNDLTTLIWNDFSSKRGWKDSASELLVKFKAESGLAARDDLQTLFEFWEVDEGRKP